MKALALGLLVLSFVAHAETQSPETRTYKKLSSLEAVVTITNNDQYTQAANYVDGLEADQFVADLAKDPNSDLAAAIKDIQMENCDETSTDAFAHIADCGSIEITKPVQVYFGRGGWASASQSSVYYVGFRSDGTGRFFSAAYSFQTSEGVEAQTDVLGDFSGTLIKVYSLDRVTKLLKEK